MCISFGSIKVELRDSHTHRSRTQESLLVNASVRSKDSAAVGAIYLPLDALRPYMLWFRVLRHEHPGEGRGAAQDK